MRTRSLGPILLIAISLCLSGLARPATALADAETSIINARFQIDDVVGNPCTGELVKISGTKHIIIRTSTDASGGLHYDVKINTEGGMATGLSSGLRYRYIEVGGGPQNVGAQGRNESTSESTFMLVSPGTAPNYLGKAVYHLTFTPDGTLAAYFQHSFVECKG